MDILIVVLLIVILAALVFAWTKFRPGAAGAGDLRRHAGGVRGQRRTAVAARHDPMAEAVERHSMATDPHEAAEAELRLQAQANRVAADLHSRQAATLESEARGIGGQSRRAAPAPATAPVDEYGRPVHADEQPVDEHGRPVYTDDQPVDEYGRPLRGDRRLR